jgi:hypothetical protein
MRRPRIQKRDVGRPVEFAAYDGETYNGRLTEVTRHGVRFVYYIRGRAHDGVLTHDRTDRLRVW